MSTGPLFDYADARQGQTDPPERVYRVGQLNRAVRLLLEDRFADVWVEGELSDVTHAGSGHVYFTLNDGKEAAQVRCVMFRSDARRSKAKLEDGARVRLRGGLSLFEPRGSYQLIARIALPDGLGELHAQFEMLRKQLEAEGLLAPERKRKLPKLPRVLGVVTSDSGAALHDIIRVANSRCPLRIVVSPCVVQGKDAPRSIVAALEAIQRLPEVETVIIGRGGGAAEDLFAFNDARVARAIAACRVPIVSAVGHEVDVTIADLVADARAATPSNAAELCVPDRQALLNEVFGQRRALERGMEVRLQRARLRLERGERSLRDPRRRLAGQRARLRAAHMRAAQYTQTRLQQKRAQLAERVARLHALSPLAVLSRGYAIALHEHTGKALIRASDANDGDSLRLRLYEGELRARVAKD